MTAKTRGGARQGAGRKPLGSPMRSVTVYLTVAQADWLARSGDGNVSWALRRLVDREMAQAERASGAAAPGAWLVAGRG